eukprot:c6423_g1_i1.p1 GENE.c6423_g1_i1~~c6423_g1_i1.p1  ORF type:complete len:382 (+),score=101.62 c6423_g1_i1:37-1182(+)
MILSFLLCWSTLALPPVLPPLSALIQQNQIASTSGGVAALALQAAMSGQFYLTGMSGVGVKLCSSCNANDVVVSQCTMFSDTVCSSQATCTFTVDNKLLRVYYDGKDISSKVSGDPNDWTVAKSFSFAEIPNAALWVVAQDIQFRVVASNYLSYMWHMPTDVPSGTFIRRREDVPDQYDERTWWLLKPALTGTPNAVSFCAKSNPSLCLRHSSFVLYLNPSDGSDLYKNDASFIMIPGLNGDAATTTFKSVNYPDRFIRHKNYKLYIDPNDGSDLFKKDSSFLLKSDDSGTCGSGGFSIKCTSTAATSPYSGLTSDPSKWKTKGYAGEPDPNNLNNGYDVSSWTTSPCTSTSTFKLNGVDPQPPKIWAPTRDRFAVFRYKP